MKNKLFASIAVAAIAVTTFSSFAQADTGGDSPWLVRIRALGIIPETGGSSTSLTPSGSLKIDNTVVPELDISYFFTQNISTELVLATSKHTVKSTTGNNNLGSVWVLPPTLTAQYHFLTDQKFQPYLGAGVNYTHFYNTDAGAFSEIHYKDTFGPALQAGADYKLDNHWLLNIDVKQVWIQPDVSVNSGAVTAKAHINPLLIGAGVGYRF